MPLQIVATMRAGDTFYITARPAKHDGSLYFLKYNPREGKGYGVRYSIDSIKDLPRNLTYPPDYWADALGEPHLNIH